jgi:hypothetical protein
LTLSRNSSLMTSDAPFDQVMLIGVWTKIR